MCVSDGCLRHVCYRTYDREPGAVTGQHVSASKQFSLIGVRHESAFYPTENERISIRTSGKRASTIRALCGAYIAVENDCDYN